MDSSRLVKIVRKYKNELNDELNKAPFDLEMALSWRG